jgi:hypothetical protein
MRKKIEFKPSENQPTETLMRNYKKRTSPEIVDDTLREEIRSDQENESKDDKSAMDPEFPDFPAE